MVKSGDFIMMIIIPADSQKSSDTADLYRFPYCPGNFSY